MMTLHERIENDYISKVAKDYGIITIRPFSGKFYFETIMVIDLEKTDANYVERETGSHIGRPGAR